MNFNQLILAGNLTRDPQVKFLPSQTQVAEFGVAVNRRWKTEGGEDREETTFVDCTAFGKTAELIGKFFTKGKPIFMVGRLKFDSWEDKNGGGKRSKLTMTVESFQFVGGPKDGDGGGEGSRPFVAEGERPKLPPRTMGDVSRQWREKADAKGPPKKPFGDDPEFKDNDIPF